MVFFGQRSALKIMAKGQVSKKLWEGFVAKGRNSDKVLDYGQKPSFGEAPRRVCGQRPESRPRRSSDTTWTEQSSLTHKTYLRYLEY